MLDVDIEEPEAISIDFYPEQPKPARHTETRLIVPHSKHKKSYNCTVGGPLTAPERLPTPLRFTTSPSRSQPSFCSSNVVYY